MKWNDTDATFGDPTKGDKGTRRMAADLGRAPPGIQGERSEGEATRDTHTDFYRKTIISTRKETVVETNVSRFALFGLHQRLAARRWWSPKGETFVSTTVSFLLLVERQNLWRKSHCWWQTPSRNGVTFAHPLFSPHSQDARHDIQDCPNNQTFCCQCPMQAPSSFQSSVALKIKDEHNTLTSANFSKHRRTMMKYVVQ